MGQSASFTYKGYLKSLGQLSHDDSFSDLRYDHILHNRFETVWRISRSFRIQADARSRLFAGYSVQNLPLFGDFIARDAGYVDMNFNWIDNNRFVLNTHIDRLHASYVDGPFEVHLGRQRINWGKTLVWNPNDLFNAYAFLDFDYEERPGTDAFNVQYHWSYASSLELGVRFGQNEMERVYAAMYRGNIGTYDFQVVAGLYQESFVAGGGWAGYIGNAGFKGELSYFFMDEAKNTLSMSIGADYMFSNGVFGTFEFLYNGGYNDFIDPALSLSSQPTASNLFISDTAVYLNVSGSVTPLINVSAGILTSPTKSIFIVIPQVSWSVAENLDILFLAQNLRGNVFDNVTNLNNYWFLRLKWSF